MKNIVQYLFILVVVALIIGAVFIFQKQDKEEAENIIQRASTDSEFATDLRYGIAEFDNINPLLSNNRNVHDISKIVYEPLLRLTVDYRLENCLASEWSKTTDNTYIVKLKENIKWHDEQDFDAEDVRFTVDKLKNEALGSIYADNVGHVVQLEVIDKYTVKFVLDTAIPFFEYNLIFPILSSKQYANQDFANVIMNPAGTGMYKIAESNSSGIKLVKNNNYWQEKEFKIEEIKIIFYSSAGELYNSFKLGNVDIVNTTVTNIEDQVGTIGFNKREYKGREFEFLALNTQNQELAYQEVRQAVAAALDKVHIINSVFGNSYYRTEFVLDYGTWLYDGTKERTTYNPDLAKQILSENGWEYKYSTWQKTVNYRTQRTNFDLVVNSTNSTHLAVANIVKEQLENIGMKITIRKVSESQYRNYINNRNYEMIIMGINTGMNIDLNTFFGYDNIAKFENEEMSTLINEVKDIQDKDLLKSKYDKIADISFEQVPYVGLYSNKYTVVYSQKLTGEVTPNWYSIFYNVNTWKRQR